MTGLLIFGILGGLLVVIGFGVFIFSEEEEAAYMLLFAALGVIILIITSSAYNSSYIEYKTPLGVEVAVNIDYEEMNSVYEKSEAQIAVLKNMGKIEKAYAIRKPLQEKINLILVNKDGKNINLTLDNEITSWTGIKFKN